MSSNPEITTSNLEPGCSPEATPLQSPYCKYLKPALDITVAWLALIACLPILLVAYLLILCESPGSPIYRQKRIGTGGKPFEIYKLRTMYDGADLLDFKTRTLDSRVTRLGRFLRDTKIDEIPQLWNVIRGEMSLIGPRPLSAEECGFITDILGYPPDYPGFRIRVKPGLTGLEQIYRIHPSVYTDRFAWNADYENKISLAQDLKILVTTMLMCNLVCVVTVVGGILELTWLAWLWLHH